MIQKHLREGARFEERIIEIDTYFNKVLYEAQERGIIKINTNSPRFFGMDLINLRLHAQFNRKSTQNKKLEQRLKSLEFQEVPKISKRKIIY